MSSEFGFIERLKTLFESVGDKNIEGIGDDCAIIPLDKAGEQLMVVTTDLLTEGVHFLREAIAPEILGRKSLAVNLSDVAAMGARPFATLLSIALPPECTGEWADRFANGYRQLSGEHNVALIGGDTTSSKGAVSISVTAIGLVGAGAIKRRSGAQSGDRIMVAGVLGESVAGLRDVLAGHYNTPAALTHHNPTPQVAEGIWFGTQQAVHSMIDLSDGLASDLRHILELSGVGARVDLEAIPAVGSVEDALTGGEDYKLLLTVAPECAQRVQAEFRAKFGGELYEIGEITESDNPRIEWFSGGKRVEKEWSGYVHF